MVYSIIVTIVALILMYGAFRDERTKREQNRQIDHLKQQNQLAWDNSRTTEQEAKKTTSNLRVEVNELKKDADHLRDLIWKFIERRHRIKGYSQRFEE